MLGGDARAAMAAGETIDSYTLERDIAAALMAAGSPTMTNDTCEENLARVQYHLSHMAGELTAARAQAQQADALRGMPTLAELNDDDRWNKVMMLAARIKDNDTGVSDDREYADRIYNIARVRIESWAKKRAAAERDADVVGREGNVP